MLTGTGIHGLKGIPLKRNNIIRPLRETNIEDIYAYLKENEFLFREDKSNSDNKYRRNYLRNIIIPELEKEFPNFNDSIEALSQQAENTEMLLDNFINETYGLIFNNSCLDISNIINNPILFKHIIAKILRESFNMYVNSGMLEDLYLKAKNSHNNSEQYQNEFLIIKKIVKDNTEYLNFIIKPDQSENIKKNYSYTLSLNSNTSIFIPEIKKTLGIAEADYNEFINSNNKGALFFSCDEIDKNSTFIIRNFLQGDKIKLKFGTKKVSDLFCDNKIPHEDRKIIPIIEFNSKIIAVFSSLSNNCNNYVSAENLVKKESTNIVSIKIYV
jgi:tRNA(Ile)-lysidine synthase